MSFDDDIRRGLQSEAGRYDPADDGWDGISAGVRSARARRRRIQAGAAGALAVAVVALGIGITATDDATNVDTGTVSSEPTDSTAVPSTTEPEPDPSPGFGHDGPFPGIWPFASDEAIHDYADGDARFEDPVATADAFARDYLGMLDPAVGAAEPADGGDVTVELRPRGESGEPAPGLSTVVTLRSYGTSYGADVWTVVAAASPNIVVDAPTDGAAVGSPLAVRGRATGYEGAVRAEVREDGMRAGESLGSDFGIAGANGEMGPLELDVAFRTPTAATGAVVVTTDTGLDTVGVPEATVVRLAFADVAQSGEAPATCATPAPPGPAPGDDHMEVAVYLICDVAVSSNTDPATHFVVASRTVPKSAGVLRATLQELARGTHRHEEELGLSSFFSDDAGDPFRRVVVEDGTAVVDLAEPVDDASTSAGSVLFRGQLDRTIFQFPTVQRIEYRLEGSCDAFWQWQQVGDCRIITRDDVG